MKQVILSTILGLLDKSTTVADGIKFKLTHSFTEASTIKYLIDLVNRDEILYEIYLQRKLDFYIATFIYYPGKSPYFKFSVSTILSDEDHRRYQSIVLNLPPTESWRTKPAPLPFGFIGVNGTYLYNFFKELLLHAPVGKFSFGDYYVTELFSRIYNGFKFIDTLRCAIPDKLITLRTPHYGFAESLEWEPNVHPKPDPPNSLVYSERALPQRFPLSLGEEGAEICEILLSWLGKSDEGVGLCEGEFTDLFVSTRTQIDFLSDPTNQENILKFLYDAGYRIYHLEFSTSINNHLTEQERKWKSEELSVRGNIWWKCSVRLFVKQTSISIYRQLWGKNYTLESGNFSLPNMNVSESNVYRFICAAVQAESSGVIDFDLYVSILKFLGTPIIYIIYDNLKKNFPDAQCKYTPAYNENIGSRNVRRHAQFTWERSIKVPTAGEPAPFPFSVMHGSAAASAVPPVDAALATLQARLKAVEMEAQQAKVALEKVNARAQNADRLAESLKKLSKEYEDLERKFLHTNAFVKMSEEGAKEALANAAAARLAMQEADRRAAAAEQARMEAEANLRLALQRLEVISAELSLRADPGGAAAAAKDLGGIPECPVCLQGFDSDKRCIMVMHCGHPICATCEPQLPAYGYDQGSFRCPLCRSTISRRDHPSIKLILDLRIPAAPKMLPAAPKAPDDPQDFYRNTK